MAGLRCDDRPVIVGRGEQLTALADALAAGRPAVAVGEAGIGKTTLLRAAAAQTGRQVFEGGALSTLRWIDYLAIDRALGRRVRAGDPAGVAAEVEAAVGDGILLLDDLQWAAPSTLDAVGFLAGRVALLAGVRVGEASTDTALDRLTASGFLTVPLGGLDHHDGRELVLRLRSDLGSAAASRLVTRTGGNPLLLRELAETGEPSASLRLALAARLRQLDEPGREAFGMLALAGRPVAVDGLGAAGAKSLIAAGLAEVGGDGRIEIRHALLGEVAVEQMAEDERHRLHMLVARNVDDPGEAARHYALAGDRVAAFAAARRAAGSATRPGERARHLAIAASCADGREADALRLEAAAALEDANDWPALSALLDQLRGAPPEVRAAAALIQARAAWRAGDPDGLRAALDEGLALVGGTGTDVEVRLLVEASRIPIFVEGDPDAAVRSTTAALDRARASGVEVPRAEYLHGTALYLACRDEAAAFLAHAAEAARAQADVSTEMLASNNLIAFHESLGDQAVGRRMALQMADRARDLGLGVWERSFRVALNNLDFHAGNYAAVLAAADELLDQPLEARAQDALMEQLCLSLIDTGRIGEAERRVAGWPSGADDDWTRKRQLIWVRTEAALWGGRPQLAAELAGQMFAGPESDLNITFAHVSRAWAMFDLGRDPGPPVRGNYSAMLAAVPDELTGISMLTAGAPGDAVDAFDRAAASWGAYHRRGELRCRWAAGEAARRAGAPDAVDRLTHAEERASQLGMTPLLSRVHRSLRAAGVRRSAPVRRTGVREVTQRERQVLELVGAGLTNAEIAARLGVSRYTVISQIGTASAKLGASSRSQAATLVDRVPAG